MSDEDTIYRQQAIDAFEKELSAKYNRNFREHAIGFVGVKRILENLPSAQPERKKGKWTKLYDDSFNCQLCGHTFMVIQGESSMNYCPNCGADMRGD